jgi:hypothetical protein
MLMPIMFDTTATHTKTKKKQNTGKAKTEPKYNKNK